MRSAPASACACAWALIAVLCAPLGLAAADPALPADTTWELRLDLRLAATHGFGALLESLDRMPFAQHLEDFGHLQLSRDVTALTLAGTPERGNGTAYLQGSFDVAALQQLVEAAPGHAESTYHGHRLDLWDGENGAGWGCVVDEHLVLLARAEAPLEQALDALDGQAPALAATAQPASLMPAPGGALASGAAVVSAGLPTARANSALVRHLQTLSLVVQAQGDGLDGTLTGTTSDPATAQRIVRLVLGLQAMANLGRDPGESKHPVVEALLETLDVSSSGSTVTATCSLSGAALAAGVAKAEARLDASAAGRGADAGAATGSGSAAGPGRGGAAAGTPRTP